MPSDPIIIAIAGLAIAVLVYGTILSRNKKNKSD